MSGGPAELIPSFLGIGGTVTLLPLSGQLSANNTEADAATQVVPGNVTITSLRGRIVNRTLQSLIAASIVVTATLFHGAGLGPLVPVLSCDATPSFTGILAAARSPSSPVPERRSSSSPATPATSS